MMIIQSNDSPGGTTYEDDDDDSRRRTMETLMRNVFGLPVHLKEEDADLLYSSLRQHRERSSGVTIRVIEGDSYQVRLRSRRFVCVFNPKARLNVVLTLPRADFSVVAGRRPDHVPRSDPF